MRQQAEKKIGQIDDREIRKWLKWAILGAGRTARDVSQSLGYQTAYVSKKLSFQDRMGKEFIAKVLGELGYSFGDFFTCVEGRLGDPRIQLGRILATAEAPPVWLSRFPSAKQQKSPKRPSVDIWELSEKRFEISLKRTSCYAGWYACFGETEAIRCEGWGVLGVVQQERAAYRHAAYCYLKALELCEMQSEEHALILRRIANLLGEVREFQLYEECLSWALGVFAACGNIEAVGRIFVNLSAANYHLGRFRNAVQASRSAIKLTKDSHHLFAAHQNAGFSLLELCKISEAMEMAEYCRDVCCNDREVFYAEFLYARCLLDQERWSKAAEAMQRASNVASYDGIFCGDQLELELMNVRCHLEMHLWRGAELGISRFRKIALMVSRGFADAYTAELQGLIQRRDAKAVLQLQLSLSGYFKKVQQSA